MRRSAAVLAMCLCAGGWLAPAGARGADGPAASSQAPSPGADQIQFAAHEHDLGYRAYVARQYDEAASHFENAFFAAPNPAELRSAVRARRDAGELGRAATLAAIGQRKFPDDVATRKLAAEVIAQARPHVFEVHISSPAECNVAVDEKVVATERVRDFRFFVSPGRHELLVSWSDDRSKRLPIDAAAGESQTLALEPPPPPPAPPPPTPPAPPATAAPPSLPSAPAVVASAPPPAKPKPFGPAVFVVGAALTAVGAGLTVWSAVDTKNNPGTDAVKRDCVGLGESCPQYQQGLRSQLRTNVAIAATGGVAVLTALVGAFLTQWSHAERAQPVGLRVVPTLGAGQAGLAGSF